MNTFSLKLDRILEFARQDPEGKGMHGESPEGREYDRLVSKEVESIGEVPGFYIWGGYRPNGLWSTIYLGKAGSGKTTSLRARVKEELKDTCRYLGQRRVAGERGQSNLAEVLPGKGW